MHERTEKQRETARRNGAASKGPQTPEGRARSARNSTRHGACAKSVFLLPHESSTEWEQLHDDCVRRFRPADEQEYKVVAQLAGIQWRLQRNTMHETEMLRMTMESNYVRNKAIERQADAEARSAIAFGYLTELGPGYNVVQRYETQLLRSWEKSARMLSLLQQTRNGRQNPSETEEAIESLPWTARLLSAEPKLQNEPRPLLHPEPPSSTQRFCRTNPSQPGQTTTKSNQ